MHTFLYKCCTELVELPAVDELNPDEVCHLCICADSFSASAAPNFYMECFRLVNHIFLHLWVDFKVTLTDLLYKSRLHSKWYLSLPACHDSFKCSKIVAFVTASAYANGRVAFRSHLYQPLSRSFRAFTDEAKVYLHVNDDDSYGPTQTAHLLASLIANS